MELKRLREREKELRQRLALEKAVLDSTHGEAQRLHAQGFAMERAELRQVEYEIALAESGKAG